jgi:hypothetical protein
MRTVTDNWLIQDAATVLTQADDPLKRIKCVDVIDGALTTRDTIQGAVGILCLAELLEQIVLSSEIGVLDNWSEAWRGVRGFQPILTQNIVQLHDIAEDDARKSQYLDELMQNTSLVEGLVEETWYATIVTNGSARYLALAEFIGRPYVPHPLRARFLARTIWRPTAAASDVVDTIINRARVKLHSIARPTSKLTQLVCSMPSFALLCLKESSVAGKSPLDVALELRQESAVIAFREDLSDVETALKTDDASALGDLVVQFETAVLEVERKLRLRRHDEAVDGPATVNVVDLPIKVPSFLHRPVAIPKHTGIVRRLVTTGMYDLGEIIARSLGIRSAPLLAALAELV